MHPVFTLIIIIMCSLRVFHISVSWNLSYSRVLKSPIFFPVNWLFSIMLLFGWSPLVLLFPSLPVFYNPLVAVWKSPIAIGMIVTFMFHSFFNSRAKSRYLSFFSLSVLLCGHRRQQSRQFCKFSFFFFVLIGMKSGLLVEIRWSVCMSKSHRSFCVSFSRTDARLCIYYLFVGSNLNSCTASSGHYHYYSLIRTFYISVSRWFFTGVWVTASLLKFPGLFLVFWPFSIMLSFGCSPLVRQLLSPSVPLIVL